MAEKCKKCNQRADAIDANDTPNLCREADDLLREWHVAGGMSCAAMVERLVDLGHTRISREAVWKHGQDPHVRDAIKGFEREAIARGYGRRSARLDRLHRIVDDLLEVIESRKIAYADAVGGHTGLVVVHERRYGTGDNSYIVKREMVDQGIINQIRKTLEQIQAEVGQTKPDPEPDPTPAVPLTEEARINLARQILARINAKPAIPSSSPAVEESGAGETSPKDERIRSTINDGGIASGLRIADRPHLRLRR